MTAWTDLGWPSSAAVEAVDGMRGVFLRAFRGSLGPGAGVLAQTAWDAWSASLLRLEGADAARRCACKAVTDSLGAHPRYAWRLWILESTLRRAVAVAAARAMDAP